MIVDVDALALGVSPATDDAEMVRRLSAMSADEREKVQRAQLAHTEKMAAVGTLAAGVAHEVNNPLAGVLASIENMRASPDDEDMRDRYLQLIADGNCCRRPLPQPVLRPQRPTPAGEAAA